MRIYFDTNVYSMIANVGDSLAVKSLLQDLNAQVLVSSFNIVSCKRSPHRRHRNPRLVCFSSFLHFRGRAPPLSALDEGFAGAAAVATGMGTASAFNKQARDSWPITIEPCSGCRRVAADTGSICSLWQRYRAGQSSIDRITEETANC